MKTLKQHFTQVGLESFAGGEAASLDHTESVALAYAADENADGRARESIEDEISHCQGDIQSLEALATALDEQRDVGLESGSAQFVQIALNSIQHRHGINPSEQTHAAMPSLECFSGRLARTATSLSLESVRNTQAIVQAHVDGLSAQLATDLN